MAAILKILKYQTQLQSDLRYEMIVPNYTINTTNANIIIVFLGYTCQKTISVNNTFRDCKPKVHITGSLGDIGTNKQHCKLSQIQLFLRLWRHRKCHDALLTILRFLLKTQCRRRGWWFHVPHSSYCWICTWTSYSLKLPAIRLFV